MPTLKKGLYKLIYGGEKKDFEINISFNYIEFYVNTSNTRYFLNDYTKISTLIKENALVITGGTGIYGTLSLGVFTDNILQSLSSNVEYYIYVYNDYELSDYDYNIFNSYFIADSNEYIYIIKSGYYKLKNNFNLNDTIETFPINFKYNISNNFSDIGINIRVENNSVYYNNSIVARYRDNIINMSIIYIEKDILMDNIDYYTIFNTIFTSNTILKQDRNNCTQILFYKGVPFESNKSDVLWFDSSTDRLAFLDKYFMFEYKNESIPNAIFYEGQNELYIPYSLDLVDLSDCNYICVRFYNGKELFYFVNSSYMTIQEDNPTWNMKITQDIFQSYFNKGNIYDNTMEHPILKDVSYSQGHQLDGDKLSILSGNIINNSLNFTSIGIKFQILFSVIDKYGTIRYFTTTAYGSEDYGVPSPTFNNIYDFYYNFIQNIISNIYSYNYYDYDSGVWSDDISLKIGNVYLAPQDIYSYRNTEIRINYYDVYGNTKHRRSIWEVDYISNPIKEGSINSSINNYISIGIFSNRITLPNLYNKEFTYKIIYSFEGLGFNINIECGNSRITLNNELSFILGYNEDRQYYLNHKYSIDMTNNAKLSMQSFQADQDAWGFLSSWIGGSYSSKSGSSASINLGNAFGVAYGILNSLFTSEYGSRDVLDVFYNQNESLKAQISDYYKFNTYSTISGSSDIFFLFTYTNSYDNLILPIGIYSFEYTNSKEILEVAKFNGYTVYGYYSELDLSKNKPINYRFLKANATILGNYSKNTQYNLENMFSNGLRIWYNPNTFLTDVEPNT